MTPLAFLSYRRSDAKETAEALYVQLRSLFGPEQIFMDVNSLNPGVMWRERIEDRLAQSTVVLALIGEQWLLAADRYGRRRIDDPEDWVRRGQTSR